MSITETDITDASDQESNATHPTATNPAKTTQADTADSTTHPTPPNSGAAEVATQPPRAGYLTIAADQTQFNADQKAAFASLGINLADPATHPHARRFLHACQSWGLDPWAGEIHLVQRGRAPQKPGDDDKRTWTLQVALNGYRRRARELSAAPGSRLRWIGKAQWLWSGGDDDPASWKAVEDPDTGDIIMKAVWWEAWPDSRGYPSMAKAVITVEDPVTGNRWKEYFVAHWKMFSVWEDEWIGGRKTGNKKLGAFWEKGPAHMLAKTAESNLLRAVFHGAFHDPEYGTVYTADEMHGADADAARQVEEAVAARRREAFRAAQEHATADPERPVVVTATVEPNTPAPQADPEPPEGVVRLADIITDVTPLTEDDRLRHLKAEIAWWTTMTGKPVANHIVARARKNIEDMTSAELLAIVGPLRAIIPIPRLREQGRHDDANTYEEFGADYIASVDVLTGRRDPAADTTPPVTDPGEPHPAPAVIEPDPADDSYPDAPY